MIWFQQPLHAANRVGTLVVLDHNEEACEEKEENIEKVNMGFILVKGNLSILKKIEKKVVKKEL